jgi:hypothetical protein
MPTLMAYSSFQRVFTHEAEARTLTLMTASTRAFARCLSASSDPLPPSRSRLRHRLASSQVPALPAEFLEPPVLCALRDAAL